MVDKLYKKLQVESRNSSSPAYSIVHGWGGSDEADMKLHIEAALAKKSRPGLDDELVQALSSWIFKKSEANMEDSLECNPNLPEVDLNVWEDITESFDPIAYAVESDLEEGELNELRGETNKGGQIRKLFALGLLKKTKGKLKYAKSGHKGSAARRKYKAQKQAEYRARKKARAQAIGNGGKDESQTPPSVPTKDTDNKSQESNMQGYRSSPHGGHFEKGAPVPYGSPVDPPSVADSQVPETDDDIEERKRIGGRMVAGPAGIKIRQGGRMVGAKDVKAKRRGKKAWMGAAGARRKAAIARKGKQAQEKKRRAAVARVAAKTRSQHASLDTYKELLPLAMEDLGRHEINEHDFAQWIDEQIHDHYLLEMVCSGCQRPMDGGTDESILEAHVDEISELPENCVLGLKCPHCGKIETDESIFDTFDSSKPLDLMEREWHYKVQKIKGVQIRRGLRASGTPDVRRSTAAKTAAVSSRAKRSAAIKRWLKTPQGSRTHRVIRSLSPRGPGAKLFAKSSKYAKDIAAIKAKSVGLKDSLEYHAAEIVEHSLGKALDQVQLHEVKRLAEDCGLRFDSLDDVIEFVDMVQEQTVVEALAEAFGVSSDQIDENWDAYFNTKTLANLCEDIPAAPMGVSHGVPVPRGTAASGGSTMPDINKVSQNARGPGPSSGTTSEKGSDEPKLGSGEAPFRDDTAAGPKAGTQSENKPVKSCPACNCPNLGTSAFCKSCGCVLPPHPQGDTDYTPPAEGNPNGYGAPANKDNSQTTVNQGVDGVSSPYGGGRKSDAYIGSGAKIEQGMPKGTTPTGTFGESKVPAGRDPLKPQKSHWPMLTTLSEQMQRRDNAKQQFGSLEEARRALTQKAIKGSTPPPQA